MWSFSNHVGKRLLELVKVSISEGFFVENKNHQLFPMCFLLFPHLMTHIQSSYTWKDMMLWLQLLKTSTYMVFFPLKGNKTVCQNPIMFEYRFCENTIRSTRRIHVWYIHLQWMVDFYCFHVAKYANHMNVMGCICPQASKSAFCMSTETSQKLTPWRDPSFPIP